jgi:PncC family amidohydrolase
MEQLVTRAATIGALLQARNQTIAVAESSAGGLIAAALLAVPGASAYFIGGGVVYTRKAFIAFTQCGEEALQKEKPGTEGSVLTRARIFREHLTTTWGLSEAGTAGPAGSRYGYPAGRSCVAVSGPVDAARIVNTGSAERVANMYAFADAALGLLEESLRKLG